MIEELDRNSGESKITQNGIRQSTKSRDFERPFAILAMYQATGKAIANVHNVATIDITAVRTKVCQ